MVKELQAEGGYRIEDYPAERCVRVWQRQQYLGRVPYENVKHVADEAPLAQVERPGPKTRVRVSDAETEVLHFDVGVSGPPEAFGLPPLPPGETSYPAVVQKVDKERGSITLDRPGTDAEHTQRVWPESRQTQLPKPQRKRKRGRG